MTKVIASSEDGGFDWIDVASPKQEDLDQLAEHYGLRKSSVEDALQPDHLPKFEKFPDYGFVIMRIYAAARESEADTLKELTNKIAIFYSDKFLITLHNNDWKELGQIDKRFVKNGECRDSFHLFNEIVRIGLMSFDEPAAKLNRTVDYLEEKVFLTNRNAPLLRSLYFLKRKVDVLRRVILMTYEIIDHIDPPAKSDEYTRDIRDLYIKQQAIFDSLAENTNQLLAMYFNVSSQRTNETIRVLTIFSVFFMPLTFIVGIYGMNFDFMPELKQRWGYPGVMILMLAIVVGIYVWFRKKKWL